MPAAILSPRARRELEAAARHIARENAEAAEALVRATILALRRIGDRPLSAAARPGLAPPRYRFRGIPGFPYLIVYDAEADPPIVARVLHMARDLPRLLADLTD